jgi:hypothetical protein
MRRTEDEIRGPAAGRPFKDKQAGVMPPFICVYAPTAPTRSVSASSRRRQMDTGARTAGGRADGLGQRTAGGCSHADARKVHGVRSIDGAWLASIGTVRKGKGKEDTVASYATRDCSTRHLLPEPHMPRLTMVRGGGGGGVVGASLTACMIVV